MGIKLKTTIEFEYEANPDIYETDNPQDMAIIDQENWRQAPRELMYVLQDFVNDGRDFSITVSPL